MKFYVVIVYKASCTCVNVVSRKVIHRKNSIGKTHHRIEKSFHRDRKIIKQTFHRIILQKSRIFVGKITHSLGMANTNEQRLPVELDCTNLATEWPIWKRNFNVYMIASGKSTQAEVTKIATFIWLVGTQGANIYNTLFPNDGSNDQLLGTQRITRHVDAVAAVPAANGFPAQPAVAAHDIEDVVQRTLVEVLQAFDRHCIPLKNVAMESYKFNGIFQKEKQKFADFETELRTQLRRCDYTCTCMWNLV